MNRRHVLIIGGVLAPLLIPIVGGAAPPFPTITCHCFTDRTYDPRRPTAADPYFLATAQNTFLSRLFGLDRKGVVLTKQQGTSGDDLWIAQALALWSGVPADGLLADRRGGKGWDEVVTSRRIDRRRLGKRTARELERRGTPEEIARGVVDDLILSRRLMGQETLDGVRREGATNQELILLLVISSRSGQSPVSMLRTVKGGGESWGALLASAGIDGAGISREVERLLPR